jgi:hypothetical protein
MHVLSSPYRVQTGFELIKSTVSFAALAGHTDSGNAECVERALQLINSLIAAAPSEKERCVRPAASPSHFAAVCMQGYDQPNRSCPSASLFLALALTLRTGCF